MSGKNKYQKLLEPYHIGPVKTRNRIVKPGAAMLYAHEDDLHTNARVRAFYEAIAKGGVGLIIVESPIIDYPIGARWRRRYRIDDDRYIQGLSELTQVIHKYGCPTFMQMNHDGPWQTMNWGDAVPLNPGPPIASSPVSMKALNDFHNEMPRQLTIAEIEEIADKFAAAAVRAQKAGFDGVDINAASSHLLHNFISPFWNRRQDEYGGSIENRARLITNIVREIKKRLGRDFPVCVTINGVEMGNIAGVSGDFVTSEDSVETGRLLEETGADAIQVRSQWLGYHAAGFFPEALFFPESPIPFKLFPPNYDYRHKGAGAHVPLAAAIKKAVTIPLIAVGRLDPDLGEKVLRAGKADFIALNRRLLADPELPNKIISGRLDDIAPCTACHTCLEPAEIKRCRINAFLGADAPYEIKPAEKRKKIVVVGGGPAGMEAARVAALRGHSVTLYEKSRQLGGLLPVAALVKSLDIEDLPALVRYFKGQLTKLGVSIKFGQEVDGKALKEIKPDVIILAAGGIPTVLEINGINRHNVVESSDLHRRLKSYSRFLGPGALGRLTRLWMPVGQRVIIIGAGKHGCELAAFLVKRGRKVTIVDADEVVGAGMFFHLRCALLDWFQKKGVVLLPGVKFMEITDKGLTIVTREGERKLIEADSIIPALPLKPNLALLESLQGHAPEVYVAGDCHEPLQIVDAITSASRIARSI
jgi:2,4-dienoyl-CoA reductase (NADPH2)